VSETFLLEIGTEEIPDRMLARAQEDLRAALAEAIAKLGLLAGEAAWSAWSTPRRLAVAVSPVRPRQADREEEVLGPAVKVAFDPEGRPTKAAEGFARSQGAPLAALLRVRGPKGDYLAIRRRVEGRPAVDLLAGACAEALARLRFPKMMRWNAGGFRFVRPIRWIVALLGDEVVPFEIAGVRSGRASRGPRAGAPEPVTLEHASGYAEALRRAGVLVDAAERRAVIHAGLAAAARSAGGELLADDELTETLAQMTERPSVIHGAFPEEFLDLPGEILVTAMRHHQRYFSVLRPGSCPDGAGRLLPAFLAVLDRGDDPRGTIRRGNEWVLRARLADARFFWQEDRKRRLESRLPDLERVVFQERLGSYRQKVSRVEALVGEIGGRLGLAGAEIDAARRAARLAKCDLTTGVVGEFPELQGVMGGLQAAADGEPEAVARAVHDHYRPAGADDDLPRDAPGLLLALADRLDTLAGYFALGYQPTGTRDPYALRRGALGAVRILMERSWFLSAGEVAGRALALYAAEVRGADDVPRRLRDFLFERVRHAAQAAGHRYDSVSAVLAVQDDDPGDAAARLRALSALRGDPHHEEAFLSLAAASKRIRNLLVADEAPARVDPAALVEAPEVRLHRAVEGVERELDGALGRRDYLGGLRAIAGLRPQVDAFLGSNRSEGVLVMAPEPGLRRNRLALLRRAGDLFRRIADFSEIVVEGEATR
jgi:glycyl-tRNA synthetase beta chain